MRHRKDHRKLSRTHSHRKALLRNLVTSLFIHERIETTVAKAKEARRLAERMITFAKRGDSPRAATWPGSCTRRTSCGSSSTPWLRGTPSGMAATRGSSGSATASATPGETAFLELVKSVEQKDEERAARIAAAEAKAPAQSGDKAGKKKKADSDGDAEAAAEDKPKRAARRNPSGRGRRGWRQAPAHGSAQSRGAELPTSGTRQQGHDAGGGDLPPAFVDGAGRATMLASRGGRVPWGRSGPGPGRARAVRATRAGHAGAGRASRLTPVDYLWVLRTSLVRAGGRAARGPAREAMGCAACSCRSWAAATPGILSDRLPAPDPSGDGARPARRLLLLAHAAGLEVHAWVNALPRGRRPRSARPAPRAERAPGVGGAHRRRAPDGPASRRGSASGCTEGVFVSPRHPAVRAGGGDRAGDRAALPRGRHPPRLHPAAAGADRVRPHLTRPLRDGVRRGPDHVRASRRGARPARLRVGGVPAGAGHRPDRARGARPIARAPGSPAQRGGSPTR